MYSFQSPQPLQPLQGLGLSALGRCVNRREAHQTGWNWIRIRFSTFVACTPLCQRCSVATQPGTVMASASSMDACKEVCLLMLKIKGITDSLDITRVTTQPQLLRSQVLPLFQMSEDLRKAGYQLNAAQFASPPAIDPSHVKLIKCFTVLLTAIVKKLRLLLDSPLSSDDADSSTGSKVLHLAFFSLWAMLCSSCSAFNQWPRAWPVGDQDDNMPTRDALHLLMDFLLCITRARSKVWCVVMEDFSLEIRLQQVYIILTVPITYLTGVYLRPASYIVKELLALPSEFMSMLSCLTLEQLAGFPRPDAHPPLQTQQTSFPSRSASVTQNLLIIYLGNLLVQLMGRVLTSHYTECVHVFAATAVIQLQKQFLVTQAESCNVSTLRYDQQDNALSLLLLTLNAANACNNLAVKGAGGIEGCRHNSGGIGIQFLPQFRPTVPAPDIKLLRALFKHLPSNSALEPLWYMLILTMLRSWRSGEQSGSLFPPTSVQVQTSGVYLAMHHVAVTCLTWMRQQGNATHANINSSSYQAHVTTMQHLVQLAIVSTSLTYHVSGLTSNVGELGFISLPYMQANCDFKTRFTHTD